MIPIKKRRNFKKRKSRRTNLKSFRMTPEIIHIVSSWEKQGIDVTQRINYAIINTYPVIITEEDYLKDLGYQRKALAYEKKQMEVYVESELRKIEQAEVRFKKAFKMDGIVETELKRIDILEKRFEHDPTPENREDVLDMLFEGKSPLRDHIREP